MLYFCIGEQMIFVEVCDQKQACSYLYSEAISVSEVVLDTAAINGFIAKIAEQSKKGDYGVPRHDCLSETCVGWARCYRSGISG